MYCPISNQLLIHPVLASNGITYNREALMNLYDEKSDHIALPDGEKIENKFFKDRVTQKKVEAFLKENPGFIMPVSEENKKKFTQALTSRNLKELELSVNEEPFLLSEKLFGEKTALQYLAQEGNSINLDILCFLLKIAKTRQDGAKWHSYFEEHIANSGKASVIVKIVQENILSVNDNTFAKQNTLLHLAVGFCHKKLVKQLIIKCGADTYLTNEENKRAKDLAPFNSGIAQLIKESIQKKVFKKMLAPKMEMLHSYNFSLQRKLNRLTEHNEVLKQELDKTRNYLKILELKNKEHAEGIEMYANKLERRITRGYETLKEEIKDAREYAEDLFA